MTPQIWCTVPVRQMLGFETKQPANTNLEKPIERVKLVKKKPLMAIDDIAKRWIKKVVKRACWRVPGYYEPDDLEQDGHLVWIRVARFYPDVTERKHMMSLFQTSFLNHIHDLAKKRTRDSNTAQQVLDDISEEIMRDAEIAEAYAAENSAPYAIQRMTKNLIANDKVKTRRLESLDEQTKTELKAVCDYYDIRIPQAAKSCPTPAETRIPEAPVERVYTNEKLVASIADRFEDWLRAWTKDLILAGLAVKPHHKDSEWSIVKKAI